MENNEKDTKSNQKKNEPINNKIAKGKSIVKMHIPLLKLPYLPNLNLTYLT
jgi:hypothetical protein